MANTSGGGVRRPPFWRSRSVPLVALLLITLGLAAVLAYEAYHATRSHRVAAERALRDYAAVAAWGVAAGATDALHATTSAAFTPLTSAKAVSPYERLPAPAVLEAAAGGVLRCGDAADSARSYFRLDFRDGSLAASGFELSAPERAQLADAVAAHARATYQPDWRFAAMLARPAGAPRAVVYSVKYAEHGAPIAAFGFTTCPAVLGATLFRGVMARHALLPASLVGSVPNDSLVAVSVDDASGRAVFHSTTATADSASTFVADVALDQVAGFRARASLRRRAVETLALGAVPPTRLPIVLGLLALTAAMVVVALLQLRRESELARLRSDFISSVSHELRTPLAQILLFAETLSLGRVRSERERRSAVEVIVQEGRRLMHLVENVLHFARAERGMERVAPQPVALAPCVREVVDTWAPLADAADVSVRVELDDAVVARVDRGALRQMLLNLLDNAVKYGPPGQTVTVGLSAVDGRARLRVEDEGVGIPPRERERIWAPFYRVEHGGAGSMGVAGSGIGLYVVRELAALHGGRVWVEPAPGGAGARFVIDLPADVSAAALRANGARHDGRLSSASGSTR